MANKKGRKNQQRCNQEFRNGGGIHNTRSRAADQKRKSKPNQQIFMNEDDYRHRLQEVLYTPEVIFAKIFRKDGPPLGDEFDPLPSNAFPGGPRRSHLEENRHHKRRKVSLHTMSDYDTCCEGSPHAQSHGMGKGPMNAHGGPVKKYGMGKGLMTKDSVRRHKYGIGKGLMSSRDFEHGSCSSGNVIQKKKKRAKPHESILKKLANRERAKRKASLRYRKVEPQKIQKRKKPHKDRCELALENAKCLENTEFAMLLDDEELELRELQEGPNPLSCSAHLTTSGSHGCSLCKDLLAKFPPSSVTMKLPLSIQPWASSPELVNKLFKVFHFISTYAATIGTHSFTIDEFARSFHDKDSLLIGLLHVALLRLLFSDIDKEICRGFFSHASKNGKYLELIHSLERHGVVLEFWQKSLNLLTWIEILCQVLTAAGFGSKLNMTRKAACIKECNVMDKYGLNPGTLKAELFSILLTQGNYGLEVSELAKSSSIVDLNLTDTVQDLENLIISALSSDITLYEKISQSRYRLQIHTVEKESLDFRSDSEDLGCGDDVSEVTGGNDANDSECESRDTSLSKSDVSKSNSHILTVYNEIDESHPGEMWLLGLMEGEYSDLSIEEKLNALTALVDLIRAGSSIRMEDPLTTSAECPPNITHFGSGAKIKRSMVKPVPLGTCDLQRSSGLDISTSEPIDSLVLMSKIVGMGNHANMKNIADKMEAEEFLHPMQCIYLGSDRRYNRYWMFLGPCDEFDPGHRRIYFESSEDGHWEMIDTKEALCSLLSNLDQRGAREARLLASLEKREAILNQTMSSAPTDSGNSQPPQSELNTCREDSSSPVSDVDNRSSLGEMQNELPASIGTAAVEAGKKGEKLVENSDDSQVFDAWIWKSFYSELNSVKNGQKAYVDSLRRCDRCQDLYWRDEKHCRFCHVTFELDFDLEERYAIHTATCQAKIDVKKCRRLKALPSQLQTLKAAIYAIESAIPEDALMGSWKKSAHNLWVNRLRRVSSLREFLQVLADFVNAINEDWLYQTSATDSYYTADEIISKFSALPQTYSAIALWLVKLDLLVASRTCVETGHSG
ncbi:homeobox-DDT domain protein RLT3-like isoform X1 [Salvia splendens]|uniref:homeobox-DDT domain protein RLT3-like isoform X1 n=1 Tax=Salvia splendens TaxID=180675 RepID=UPI001101107B|nr:homeobox-DDT domain protein RLT3-like isoform X1 [Salvia splendens]